MPRLLFRESSCHQCGFCEALCPEGAIRLEPRLLCDPDRIEAQVVLHEAVPFRCIECGAPFASPAMVTRMERKLAGHWMYAGTRQLRRLRMCRTCRTRDALISKDAALW
jgi:ferredoxin